MSEELLKCAWFLLSRGGEASIYAAIRMTAIAVQLGPEHSNSPTYARILNHPSFKWVMSTPMHNAQTTAVIAEIRALFPKSMTNDSIAVRLTIQKLEGKSPRRDQTYEEARIDISTFFLAPICFCWEPYHTYDDNCKHFRFERVGRNEWQRIKRLCGPFYLRVGGEIRGHERNYFRPGMAANS